MPSDRKDRASYKRGHGGSGNSSPRTGGGHHRKASDSGVGSSSDQDSLAANPDRAFTAQDYLQQSQNPYAVNEALENARIELARLKDTCKQLTAENQTLRSDSRDLNALYRAQMDRNAVLEMDVENLDKENRALKEQTSALQNRNYALIDEIGRFQQNSAAYAPPPPPSSITGTHHHHGHHGHDVQSGKEQPKLHRRESKKGKHPDRQAEEKVRLQTRFVPKEETAPTSSHSGHSTHSGRSRRDSYVEPFGPGGRPAPSPFLPQSVPSSAATSHPPRVKRTYSTSGYAGSSARPAVITTISTPKYAEITRSPHASTHSSTYSSEAVFDDDLEDGDYQKYPLPEKGHRSRR